MSQPRHFSLVALLLGAVACTSSGSTTPTTTTTPSVETSEAGLYAIDVGSGEETAFTAPLGASEFDVTLDGSMVAFTDVDENGNAQVFVMAADESNARQLTHGESGAYGPTWSPDGSKIAYVRGFDTGDEEAQIFIVGVSDGVSTKVTSEPRGAFDPGGWAPDGGSIVYSTINDAGDLYAARSLDLASGRSRTIVADGSVPTPSPDGAKIVFNSMLKLQVRLILANIDGSEPLTIARLDGDDGHQKWSPDSTQIAFVGSTDEDGYGTYVYDLATGETRFVAGGTFESWMDNQTLLVLV